MAGSRGEKDVYNHAHRFLQAFLRSILQDTLSRRRLFASTLIYDTCGTFTAMWNFCNDLLGFLLALRIWAARRGEGLLMAC